VSEEIKIPLPSNVKLRKQNPQCNEEGHLCGLFEGVPACIIPKLEKDESGDFVLFEIKPCKHSDKVFKIELRTDRSDLDE